MPDHSQKLDTTRRSRDMSAAEQVTKVRSSAKPRLGVRRPVMVLCPMLVAFRAKRSALKMSPNSSGESLSPCFCPRSR